MFWFVCVLKATHPGLLKISGLQEGVYTFQMTVTDTAGQKSSDNVSVTVLAPKHQAEGDVVTKTSVSVIRFLYDASVFRPVPDYVKSGLSVLCAQCAQVTVRTTSSSVMTAAVLTSHTPVMGSSTAPTAPMKTSAPTVRNISLLESPGLTSVLNVFPPPMSFSVISVVDSSRKSVNHPVDLTSPHRPVVQTEESEDSSMLQAAPEKKIISLQDRIKTAPLQSPAQQDSSVTQGRTGFTFKVLICLAR